MLALSSLPLTAKVGSDKGDNGPSWMRASFPHWNSVCKDRIRNELAQDPEQSDKCMALWDLRSFFAQMLTQWRLLKYSASMLRGRPDMEQLKIAPNRSRVCNSVALKGSAHSQECPMLWSCHHAFPARVDWISIKLRA